MKTIMKEVSMKIKNKLKNFYKPYNEKLFDLIGREIVEWNNEKENDFFFNMWVSEVWNDITLL